MSGKGSSTHSDKQCQYCNKIFSYKASRLIHERIHTGVKPYTCNTCRKFFDQMSSVIRHVISTYRLAGGSPVVNDSGGWEFSIEP